MHTIDRAFLATALAVTACCTGLLERVPAPRRGDAGQASTEYAGILFVIVAIIAALIAVGFADVGQAIRDKIVEAVGNVGN